MASFTEKKHYQKMKLCSSKAPVTSYSQFVALFGLHIEQKKVNLEYKLKHSY